MMPTTFESIRDQQMVVLEALVPSQHAGKRFRRHVDHVPFMEWIAKTPRAAFRSFEIAHNFDIEQGPTADGSLESCRHTLELRVAYPLKEQGLYGQGNFRDMEDLIAADLHKIDAAIGLNGGANYVASQDLCEKQAQSISDADGVRVLSITYLVQYDRSV